MRFTDTLPTPPAEALAHSGQLARLIHDRIQQAGGSIPFRDFMHMALYEPGLGYYVAGLHKIGAGGDFVTAPEISALFPQCLANQCAEILRELPVGDILELGAGSGKMAAELLLQLESLGCLPERYLILDLSPSLKQRQRETIQAHAGHLLERVVWLDTLPTALRGVILGNEVLDAMPVELFTLDAGVYYQLQVAWGDAGLELQRVEAPPPQPALPLPQTDARYTSEYNPALPAWMQSLTTALEAGVILLIDYGYEQRDYYHPERSEGTLICHYQQRVHDNPLWWPGLQDITANVDFTALAEAGCDAGLELAGYTTQALFLVNTGLEALFAAQLASHPQRQYPLAQQVRLLTLPSEMGERFKVMAFRKRFTAELQGFRLGDQRHRL